MRRRRFGKGHKELTRHGGPEKKNIAIAAQYAPVASCFGGGMLCRMLELRRAEASPSHLRVLRPL
jgi:hypothetical protein